MIFVQENASNKPPMVESEIVKVGVLAGIKFHFLFIYLFILKSSRVFIEFLVQNTKQGASCYFSDSTVVNKGFSLPC